MKIAIIGAGPCGLGAAKTLADNGFTDWALFERQGHSGGLAASFVDDRGFTWDQGGHVIFSHFQEFDKMLEDTCGDHLLFHTRKSFIQVGHCRVPYPFQNNLRYLPRELALEVLRGLKQAPGGKAGMPFDQWLKATFGEGMYRIFMEPYNRKVWATDLSRMAAQWISERISVVDYDRALQNLILEGDDVDWGPNSTFIFPLRGGTGEIFRRLAGQLRQENIRYNSEVVGLDLKRKELTLQDGSRFRFDYLITTMPLDQLVARTSGLADSMRKSALDLRHSGTYAVGYGFPERLREDWCWVYFPESDVPFNRVTNFAHYSPFNVPAGRTDRYCSFMCETSFSDTKKEQEKQVVEMTLEGLRRRNLISKTANPASLYVIEIPYAYPVPTHERDKALRHIQPYLMERGVYSRGRFGAWLYELGNMDHSFKQGVDVAKFILFGEQEAEWTLR